ncbi:MAG: thiamine-monophosphate kinase [Xanthobacteraceae bacterium]|nr:thiamine-monophosphate kinase [Xanthobacteraceae bacterium]
MAKGGRSQESGEDRLIARYFKPLAQHPAALGLADDAACLTPPKSHDLVLTVDAVVAGVHFLPDDPPASIARKALRVNLSDLAAKGATPLGFLLTLALPPNTDAKFLKPFAKALAQDARVYGCPVLGGDTTGTPGPLTISITAFGTVPHGKMVRRQGARPGDLVMVTGTIGDAALGLRLSQRAGLATQWRLKRGQGAFLVERYREPQPRHALAEAVRRYASAAMDVSDGLAGDLAKLCRASNVSAVAEATQVPLSPAASVALATKPDLFETILTGGDDYEILCTVPRARAARFSAAAKAAGVPLTTIGRIEAGRADMAPGEARFVDANGQPLRFVRGSFSHFG